MIAQNYLVNSFLLRNAFNRHVWSGLVDPRYFVTAPLTDAVPTDAHKSLTSPPDLDNTAIVRPPANPYHS